MNLDAYFERIGYTEGGSAEERLRRLHIGHITHIPFENLDVFNGKTLDLTPEGLEKKLVENRRGGYCWEMNGLFCAEAAAMGFSIYGVLARVARGSEGYGGLSHRMNVAEAGGARWICDVGFGGDCFTEPLLYEEGREQKTAHGESYRVVFDENPRVRVQILRPNGWENLLGFDDIPAREDDFQICNYFTNCHPTSGFRNMLMVNRFMENGRYSMFNNMLNITENGASERKMLGDDELGAALTEYFGIGEVPNRPFPRFPAQK